MSVKVREVKDSLSAQAQLSDDLKGTITATRKFLITSDDSLTEAKALSQGPAFASSHPNIPYVYCVSKQVEPLRQDLKTWELVCTYRNVYVEAQQYNPNPLLRPPQISWSSVSYEEDFIKDVTGKAVLNSAGDYFEPPAKVQRSRWQVTYAKNVPGVPPWIFGYIDAINSDNFYLDGVSVPRACAFLESVQISPVKIEDNYAFRELTLSFLLQGYSWQPMILDQGLYEKDANGERKRIRIGGEPVSDPVLLDGNGKPLVDPSPSNARFLPFKAYKELPFSSIL
mgnify:CR=1 FL=1